MGFLFIRSLRSLLQSRPPSLLPSFTRRSGRLRTPLYICFLAERGGFLFSHFIRSEPGNAIWHSLRTPLSLFFIGGEGGVRTHVEGFPPESLSRRARYDRFGTSPYIYLTVLFVDNIKIRLLRTTHPIRMGTPVPRNDSREIIS